MTPIRIDIPNAKPLTVAQSAGQIAIDALNEAGLCERKAASNPMVRQMAGMWGRGEWTREQFVKACRNVLILNPGLAKG